MFKLFKTLFSKELPSNQSNDERADSINEKILESISDVTYMTDRLAYEAIETAELLKNELAFTKNKMHVISENVDDVIIVKTINRQWVDINTFACEVFNLNREQCIGKTNADLIKEKPNLKDFIENLDIMENKVWKSKTSEKMSCVIKTDDKILYLEIVIIPLSDPENNTAKELIIVGRNCNKFHNIKLCYNLFNEMNSPLFLMDSLDRIVYVNDKVYSEFKISNSIKFESKTCYDALSCLGFKKQFENKFNSLNTLLFIENEYIVKKIPIFKDVNETPMYSILTIKKINNE